jgi:hypothetical protein
MENNFVSHAIKLTFPLAVFVSLVLGFCFNFFDASGVLLGAFWGMANVYCLKKSLENLLKTETRNGWLFFIFLQIKFPMLYLIGYFLLKVFSPLYLALGSTLVFVSILMLGIYLAIFDKSSQTKGLA